MKAVRPFTVGVLLSMLVCYSTVIISLSLVFPGVWLLAFLTLPIPWIAILRASHRTVFK